MTEDRDHAGGAQRLAQIRRQLKSSNLLRGIRDQLEALAQRLKLPRPPKIDPPRLPPELVTSLRDGWGRFQQECERLEAEQREQEPSRRASKGVRRGRGEIEFPYLEEALQDLANKRKWKPLTSKADQAAHVLEFLRKRGVKVPKEQLRTIERRIEKRFGSFSGD